MTTLKAALQEAYFMELEELPSEEILSEDEALTFSPAFERKMKKLIRRADHPIRYRIAQAAACLLLAALLSGCLTSMLSKSKPKPALMLRMAAIWTGTTKSSAPAFRPCGMLT